MDYSNFANHSTPFEDVQHERLQTSRYTNGSRTKLPIVEGAANHENSQPYRQLVGCLIHATQTTRPDLCSSTFYLSRFQHCFTSEHYSHAKRILRYIQGTQDLKMKYIRDENSSILVGYSSSDCAADKNDFKSTSGYVF